jgi:hypothetical protein
MLQVFYMDVAKVDQDAASVSEAAADLQEAGWAPAPLMTGFTTKNTVAKISNHR